MGNKFRPDSSVDDSTVVVVAVADGILLDLARKDKCIPEAAAPCNTPIKEVFPKSPIDANTKGGIGVVVLAAYAVVWRWTLLLLLTTTNNNNSNNSVDESIR